MNSQRAGKTDSRETIAYIRQMLGELRLVAEREEAQMLCYLIEMAYEEAGDLQNRVRPGLSRQRVTPQA
ncbi:hypothetical protein NAC44_07660 [Allorhizobium sp. BGMRC 0089]|uniref:hypothetical protein n=1 Tax=Allorhizobium sonneratiae TaxID=2934936 RepID=UPI002034531A|nr:hypothetical protein [Allorhizobium sonneratiae]MCM2292202.1 hypothetical protein [Allorhizobium sonneratiae]